MPNLETLARRNYQAYHLRGEVAVDRVLRFERLADDLAEVWAHLGLPGEPDLPHAKAGARPAGAGYRDLYDERVRGAGARAVRAGDRGAGLPVLTPVTPGAAYSTKRLEGHSSARSTGNRSCTKR